MKKYLTHTLLPLALLPLLACGQTPVSNHGKASDAPAASSDINGAITTKLEKTYAGQSLKVQSVRTTPVTGLYEVVVNGNQVVYVNEKATHMLVGDLIDIDTRKSLTEERNLELSKVDFSGLPFDKAIKEVRGNGKLKVAVFSDPDCPFCKRLEREFAKMNNITIYNFMMPIASLHPDAARKAQQIWCSPNRAAAWTAWMREGKMPPKVADCENPVAETTSLGEQLGFNGTPAIVFPNGRTQSGYSPMPHLQEAIEKNQ
ncbi:MULTISPECIES: DsbC family protein [unclassified Neisseria]|uniref:DsbC family protein n=1 Tax=unclassified Neisseria TaxID=2623750 RepID=UPI002665BCA6|nr:MULTISPECIES: DsbC family protein [unclassified Neisseria]MDO1510742.1 DsbC family protein [Neisseria sp. MVDL19-042950]MDO1517032.1 DsbC family protein [Neisseria sp. MVDL18-041461]MDO1564394.1 DsbC family protein [Neisseria sp. MVDL20-010259]